MKSPSQNTISPIWRRYPATALVIGYAIVGCGWLGWKLTHGESLASLFFTNEQRAQLALNHDDFAAAAGFFPDALRTGKALYFDGDFTAAVEAFQSVDSIEGLFHLANTYAQDSNYLYALGTYNILLEREPTHPAAAHNREIVNAIVEEMKAMGESQQQGEGDPKRSEEVSPPPGLDLEMEEQMDFGERPPPEQWTADQLLNDPAMADLWMQQVQSDPANFLTAKFSIQMSNRSAPPPERDTNEEAPE